MNQILELGMSGDPEGAAMTMEFDIRFKIANTIMRS
jgi:hypothetical protein